MNRVDEILQAKAPMLMVPIHEPLAALEHGRRYLAGRQGLFVEVVKQPWLHARLPLGPPVRLPYGEVKRVLEVHVPDLKPLYEAFVDFARSSLPHEVAAWVVRDQEGVFRLLPLEAKASSVAHVDYVRPQLSAGEELVVDLHSHGRMKAFFSSTDDADDVAGVKIAGVYGQVHRAQPSSCFRLCLHGHFLPLDWGTEAGEDA